MPILMATAGLTEAALTEAALTDAASTDAASTVICRARDRIPFPRPRCARPARPLGRSVPTSGCRHSGTRRRPAVVPVDAEQRGGLRGGGEAARPHAAAGAELGAQRRVVG